MLYKISDKDTDVPIKRVDTVRNLGILIDEKLSFKEHIHDKINKFTQRGISNIHIYTGVIHIVCLLCPNETADRSTHIVFVCCELRDNQGWS